MEKVVWISIISMAGLGMVFALMLALAYKKLRVEENPLVEKVAELLPGLNCGACGCASCFALAEAIVARERPVNSCPVGGRKVAQAIARHLGMEDVHQEELVVRLKCRGGVQESRELAVYDGPADCRAAHLILGGFKACPYGCLGLGTCQQVCPVNAIEIGENRLPIVDDDKCVGCGLCVKNCPTGVLMLIRRDDLDKVVVGCSSHDKGKDVLAVCEVGCIACGICQRSCPEGAIKLVDNLPVIDYELCKGCGICVEKCPRNTIYWAKVRSEEARGVPEESVRSGGGSG